ncbi:hypothetical protein [Candidatus Clostridium stratigraminis]|uniref:Uncharacterized protein n=1 Tax=Candidatus Clostridium stratigraminis TaxID=3381661 RepID=A0ABW8SYP6_9CLOT
MKDTMCTIANFNCTFNVDGESKPMLEYFQSIILPAMSNPKIMRETKKGEQITAKYFLYDVELIEISKGEYALIGKHVKRAFLRIDQDITPEEGIVPIGETRTSAPYSIFILLLRNHRVIYFKNSDQGAPDIRSFSKTVREIVRQFLRGKRNDLINELKNSKFIYDEVEYKKIRDFTEKVLNKKYPDSEINIVPIESNELIEEKFKEIYKIKKFNLYVYKLNSENHYDDYLDSVSNFATTIGTEKIVQTANGPKNIGAIKKMLSSARGKFDYLIDAISRKDDKIKLRPTDVSESIPIKYDEKSTDEDIVKSVYELVKSKSEVSNDNSEINASLYKGKQTLFSDLLYKFKN